MKTLNKLVHWLEPSRACEIAQAEAGMHAAHERLQIVISRDTAVAKTVMDHKLDRNRNHYGERIMHALRGEYL